MIEVLKQMVEVFDGDWTKEAVSSEWAEKAMNTLDNAKKAISDLEKQEPVIIDHAPIYYMRDNHTFKKLSTDVSTALVEIENEFNDGWIYGMLCSKQEGFPTIHANGDRDRLRFFAECKSVLEKTYGIKETK
jgi:hypothetical protein